MFTGSQKKRKREEELLAIGGRADDNGSQISAEAEKLWPRLSSNIGPEVSRSGSCQLVRPNRQELKSPYSKEPRNQVDNQAGNVLLIYTWIMITTKSVDHYLIQTISIALVFESPVQSGLLTLRDLNRNCNRSINILGSQKTGLDWCRPVFFSLDRFFNWSQSLTSFDQFWLVFLIFLKW